MRYLSTGLAGLLLGVASTLLVGWLASEADYQRRHAYDPLEYR